MLDPVDAALDNLCVLLRSRGRFGALLKQMRREQNRAERIADVVADDGENPLLEVLRERELFLIVLLLNFLRLAPLVG